MRTAKLSLLFIFMLCSDSDHHKFQLTELTLSVGCRDRWMMAPLVQVQENEGEERG